MKVTDRFYSSETNLVAATLVIAILLAVIKGTAISPLVPKLLDLLLTVPLQLVPALPLLGVQVLDEATLKSVGNEFF